MSKWIDIDYTQGIGTIGYLVETANGSTGRTTWTLRERPLRTNQSHEARLSGWCGETDNRSRTACGVWTVVQVNASGERGRLTQLTGEQLASFLEKDGYPELIPATGPAEAERAEEFADEQRLGMKGPRATNRDG